MAVFPRRVMVFCIRYNSNPLLFSETFLSRDICRKFFTEISLKMVRGVCRSSSVNHSCLVLHSQSKAIHTLAYTYVFGLASILFSCPFRRTQSKAIVCNFWCSPRFLALALHRNPAYGIICDDSCDDVIVLYAS